jgi:tetratricopeptide (TPR) repeat protein/tRNA A-37 threonylcarbamoyl transferase component Bud32
MADPTNTDNTIDLAPGAQAEAQPRIESAATLPITDAARDTAPARPEATGADATALLVTPAPDETVELAGTVRPAGTVVLLPATELLAPSAPDEPHRENGQAVARTEVQPALSDQTIDLRSRVEPVATLDLQSGTQSATQKIIAVSPVKRPEAAAGMPKVPGYEILGVLGRGGMGVVYKARQLKLNRLVALKMVLGGAHAGPEQLARFFTEAEAVARLQHPNIVQIYEVGELDGLPFFSLEYVSGGTLADKIGGKPQPPREAAETVELLAYAMAAAHERSIIHRDLKPANVLVSADGLPKITDFGLAKRIEDDSSQTRSGTLMGTPSYMSPEQARGQTHAIGPLSDLYSLGAMLYELITARPPFVGPTMLETLFQVRNQEPVPPTHLQPKCPRDLETICLKSLQKEQHKRYPNCEALADDLHRFLAGEPIKARPVGWLERAWRWCRRNPRVAILSAAVGVLLAAVGVSLAVVAVRLGREREAVAETRKVAAERFQQATARIAAGNFQQAQDLLQWSDPLLSHADLTDVRANLATLKAQVDVYAEFRQLLDQARFACRFGSRRQKEEGRDYCHKLLSLYDEIEGRTGRGAFGLPPLNDEQQQLFKEDVFEALMTSAGIEQELVAKADKAAERQAASKALGWFNRAEQVVPGTRTLLVHRAPCRTLLGEAEAAQADMAKAKTIAPTSAVDRFWHGFADHLRGDEALAKKDIAAARDFYHKEIAQYAAFLQQRPEHFWGYFNWANAHLQLNQRDDLNDALIGFTACIRLGPDFPWPYNNRGIIHLNSGAADQAVLDFSAALARSENYPEAHLNRGLAYVALKKPDLAVVDFTKAIALNADLGTAYVERAQIYRQRKQYDLAIQDYGRLIEQNPKNLQARANRAEVLLGLGKHAAARADFTSILDQAPRAAVIWRARAILNWQNLKDFDAALADFERFLELAPKDAEAYRSIGAILFGRRQYPAALNSLQKALVLRPDYPDATWALAQVYLRQGKANEALKELDALVAKLPAGPPETLNVRAGVYEALGRLDDAARDYSRMIELKPKEPEAYVNLARLHEKRDQRAEATACLDRLVSAAPDSAWAFVRRAECRRNNGNFDGALSDCDQADAKSPAWPVPALVRASVRAARGDMEAAISDAERALEKAPPDDGHVLYAAACVWSLAAGSAKDPAQKKRLAEQGVDFLARALDKGFHDLIYPEHNRLPDDPALVAIRDLPRVQDLLGKGR